MGKSFNKLKFDLNMYNISNYKKEIENINCNLGLQRIRVLSLSLLVVALLYFYADCVIFIGVEDKIFKVTLFSIHIISVISSILFLVFYKQLLAHRWGIRFSMLIVRSYIFFTLLISALASLNSQRLTGNIEAYIVAILILAVLFPIEPLFMIFTFTINHILFLIGLTFMSHDPYTLISKEINSTAMMVGSLVFCCSLYRYRIKEFITKHQLSQSEGNFRKVFNLNPLPMFIAHYEDGKVLIANDRSSEFYDYSKEGFHKIYAHELYADKADRRLMLNKLDNNIKAENYIVEHKTSSGTKKWVIANYEIIEYMGEKCVLTNVTDITELKKMENELLSHASTDVLTGVLNRRTGVEALRILISSKDSSRISSICFIDIDGLKEVNDKFGHNEGDYLINKVCSVIKETLSNDGSIFRFGGDEFVILLPDKTEKESEALWSKIQTKFLEINNLGIKPYKIVTSHGVIEFTGTTNLSVEELLDLADKKMYIEKKSHKSNPR